MMDTDVKTGSSLLKDKEAPEYMREISITTGYRQRLSYKGCVVRFVNSSKQFIIEKFLDFISDQVHT
jgi:hypothetical protein